MNTVQLILKSLAGMVFLFLVMALVLFLPFGGTNYPLAWVYLAIFFLSSIIITIYLFLFDKHLLQSRLAAGPAAEQRPAQKLIQSVAGLTFIAIFILSALDYRHHWSNVSHLMSYISSVMCCIAFAFLFAVFKQNPFLSAKIEVQHQQQVVSTGLYGVIRHPMYTGALLLILFTPPALGSCWGLIPAIMLTTAIAARAVDEEKELKKNLGGYDDYCKKVKYRLIPFIF